MSGAARSHGERRATLFARVGVWLLPSGPYRARNPGESAMPANNDVGRIVAFDGRSAVDAAILVSQIFKPPMKALVRRVVGVAAALRHVWHDSNCASEPYWCAR